MKSNLEYDGEKNLKEYVDHVVRFYNLEDEEHGKLVDMIADAYVNGANSVINHLNEVIENLHITRSHYEF